MVAIDLWMPPCTKGEYSIKVIHVSFEWKKSEDLPLYKWLSYQANAYIFSLFYPSPYHRISFKVEIKLFDPHVA